MKIGVQGDLYSNTYFAALKYAEEQHINLEEVPLINSYPVFRALMQHEVDYAIVAHRNSTAGPVKETRKALEKFGDQVEEIAEISLAIHHCLYRLPGDDSALQAIYSHEQALRQCEAYTGANYPDAAIIPEKDTSLAAWKLAKGEYGSGTGVICNRGCGDHFGLQLVQDCIETMKDNHTTFKVFVRKGEA